VVSDADFIVLQSSAELREVLQSCTRFSQKWKSVLWLSDLWRRVVLQVARNISEKHITSVSSFSEILVATYNTTRCQNTEDHNLESIVLSSISVYHVNWVSFHHGMVGPQTAVGGLHIWRVAANILNNQPRTTDKGRSYELI